MVHRESAERLAGGSEEQTQGQHPQGLSPLAPSQPGERAPGKDDEQQHGNTRNEPDDETQQPARVRLQRIVAHDRDDQVVPQRRPSRQNHHQGGVGGQGAERIRVVEPGQQRGSQDQGDLADQGPRRRRRLCCGRDCWSSANGRRRKRGCPNRSSCVACPRDRRGDPLVGSVGTAPWSLLGCHERRPSRRSKRAGEPEAGAKAARRIDRAQRGLDKDDLRWNVDGPDQANGSKPTWGRRA